MLSFKAAALALSVIGASGDLYFSETFDNGDVFKSGKWILSTKEKYSEQPIMIKPAIKCPPELSEDNGVELTQEMKFYGFGSAFETPIDTTGKDFIVQYEVKLDNLQCGGAYIKLPRASDGFNMGELDNDTPYTIMFGPDRCGTSNKVHFILQHQNPISGEWEEKHFSDPAVARMDQNTHLYTLAVHKDNSFEIYIDMELEKSGNLLTSMAPPVNPSKTIDDPEDFKPADWVDDAQIPDPSASKPEEWDEDAPMMIEDQEDVKPAGWLDNEPRMIPDPEAEKPDDWDDEEDGVWEAPTVLNPLCEDVGCGEWTPRKIRNPLYVGKWSAPLIDNPEYKGEWAPRQIDNPSYFEDERPADMAPIAGVAVEVWTTNSGIHFDNFVVASDLSEAFDFAKETFRLKEQAEKAQDLREVEERRKEARENLLAEGGFVNVAQVYLAEFLDMAGTQSPIALVSALILIFATIFFCLPSGPSASAQSTPDETPESSQSAPKETSAAVDESSEKKKQEEEEVTAAPSDDEEEEEEEEEETPKSKKSPSKRRPRKAE